MRNYFRESPSPDGRHQGERRKFMPSFQPGKHRLAAAESPPAQAAPKPAEQARQVAEAETEIPPSETSVDAAVDAISTPEAQRALGVRLLDEIRARLAPGKEPHLSLRDVQAVTELLSNQDDPQTDAAQTELVTSLWEFYDRHATAAEREQTAPFLNQALQATYGDLRAEAQDRRGVLGPSIVTTFGNTGNATVELAWEPPQRSFHAVTSARLRLGQNGLWNLQYGDQKEPMVLPVGEATVLDSGLHLLPEDDSTIRVTNPGPAPDTHWSTFICPSPAEYRAHREAEERAGRARRSP